MKYKFVKLICTILSLILFLTILPFSAFAAEDGLAKEIGTETPEIYCTYKTYKNGVIGNEVNGNSLSAGFYTVTFSIKGMSTFARINLGVTVNNDFAALGTWKDSAFTADSGNPISDLTADYQSVIPVESVNQSQIFASFASNEENYTAINSDGTAIITVGMEVLQSCDAESIFEINTNPNVTFAQPYYSMNSVPLDDYDCYSLFVDASNYEGKLYSMTKDISPYVEINGYTVSGTIRIMTDLSGTKGAVAPGITVKLGDNSVVSDSNGNFVFNDIPSGVYETTIIGLTTIDRTLNVVIDNEDISLGDVLIVVCDYNHDSKINTLDKSNFSYGVDKNTSEDESFVNFDFNGDGKINTLDKIVFQNFVDQDMSIVYDNLNK